MRIYRFILPQQDNAGKAMLEAWGTLRRDVLKLAGGYTLQPEVEGAWLDDKGQEYRDRSWVLDVALDRVTSYRPILNRIQALWPDQLSFFVADVGEAYFIPGTAAEPALSGAGAEWIEEVA